jgi:anti-sigma B factor antagonist
VGEHPGPATRRQVAGEPSGRVRPLRRRCAYSTYEELAVAVEDRAAATTVVHVFGEIDILTGGHLEALLCRELAHRPHTLVVDLTDVALLGSTGLSILSRVHDHCLGQGTVLSVSCPGRGDVVRQLRIAGLERLSDGDD